MSLIRIHCVLVLALVVLAGRAMPQEHESDTCSYSVLDNGPTWNGEGMRIPYDVIAMAWARNGAYGGLGRSTATGFHKGGAGVAVASVSYWFKVTHHPLEECVPVEFESDGALNAQVETTINGSHDDYALATGFQWIGGVALPATSMAVAATNSGSPVQNSTIGVAFGAVNFTLTIPGVSVTTDTVDHDRKTVTSAGRRQTEEEIITVNCWAKIKVVASGPFGGTASATVVTSSAEASTKSTCKIHSVTGTFAFKAVEE